MSATVALSPFGDAVAGKLRVLPGSVDLFIAYPSSDANAAAAAGSIGGSSSGSAVAWLNNNLQRERRDQQLNSDAVVSLPPSVSAPLWLYEQLRVLLCELNTLLAVALSPLCTAAVCPVMIATADWEFLCAAHGSKPLKVTRSANQPHARQLS